MGCRPEDIRQADNLAAVADLLGAYGYRAVFITLTTDRSKFLSPALAYERCKARGCRVARAVSVISMAVIEPQTKTGDGWIHWHVVAFVSKRDKRSAAEIKKRVELLWQCRDPKIDLETGEYTRGSLFSCGICDVQFAGSVGGVARYVAKYIMKAWPAIPPWMLDSNGRRRKYRASDQYFELLEDLHRHDRQRGKRPEPSGRRLRAARPLRERMAASGTCTDVIVSDGGKSRYSCTLPGPVPFWVDRFALVSRVQIIKLGSENNGYVKWGPADEPWPAATSHRQVSTFWPQLALAAEPIDVPTLEDSMTLALVSVLSVLIGQGVVTDTLPRRGALGVSFTPVPQTQAAELKLEPDQGVVAMKPVVGLTAEKAGIQPGDIVVTLNGKRVGMTTIGATVRELPSGKPLAIGLIRGGKSVTIDTTLVERPRDPGNANYEVVYDHVVSHGKKMRTILTKPKTPGNHPGFVFIQGFSPISYDYTLETATGDVATIDGPILFEFANSGFVTLRVEKPGIGDSEGGPFAELDYTTELDIYRQALIQLKQTSGVDAGNVFIFGHSMGGAFGPMIAAEIPVKGLAVYGVAARTWYEYFLDTIRYQGLVGGDNLENADEKVRLGAQLMALVFLEGKSVDEVKKSHPPLVEMADAIFPGGLFSGKSLEFWRQLGQTNFASYWTKCNAHVLAVRGASDFVTYDVDHKLVADIVNAVHPGWGKSAVLPASDHLFHNFATEQESMRNFQRGKFNPAFGKLMKDWIGEVMAAKDK